MAVYKPPQLLPDSELMQNKFVVSAWYFKAALVLVRDATFQCAPQPKLTILHHRYHHHHHHHRRRRCRHAFVIAVCSAHNCGLQPEHHWTAHVECMPWNSGLDGDVHHSMLLLSTVKDTRSS